MNAQEFTIKDYLILVVLLLSLLGLTGCDTVMPVTVDSLSTEVVPKDIPVKRADEVVSGEFGSEPVPKPDTLTYSNVIYGFGFDYPEGWSINEDVHGVILKKGTNRLGITCGWEDERDSSYFGRTGVGAGDFFYAGKIDFLGQIIPTEELIFEGKSKGVFFGGTGLIETEDLVFSITLEDLDLDYLAVDLSAEIMAEATSIIESFKLIDREADSEPGLATKETGLIARLEIPAQLTVGEEVNLKFVLKNASDTPLYVLKWYTPLEGIAGEIFRVTHDGQAVPYEGILASRGAPTPETYVLLYPGESVSSVVDLADGYDLSQVGEYQIKFISPRISHIARTEAKMARTMEELGPVSIPSNEVSVQLNGSSTDQGILRLYMLEEAHELIEAYLRDQTLDLGVEPILPVEELHLDELWSALGVQIFKVSEGKFLKESFLIRGSKVIQLGAALGGQGLISLVVADLDRDGQAELYYAYSSGVENSRSRVGMYAPTYDEFAVIEAAMGYPGHWRVFSEDGSRVRVQIVEGDQETKTLRYLDMIGDLAIAREDDKVELTLQLDPHLPDEIRQKISPIVDDCISSSTSDSKHSDTAKAQSALQALIDFFAYLHAGKYERAVELYGGGYEVMQDNNPNIDPEDHAALFRNACTVNGAQCLEIEHVNLVEQPSDAEFRFAIQFVNDDGSIFTQGPCCGEEDLERFPPLDEFFFTVRLECTGNYHVLEMPVYLP